MISIFGNFTLELISNNMSLKFAIINCYVDEPKSAPSAQLFTDNLINTTIINHCYGEKISNISQYDGYVISGSRSCHLDQDDWIIKLHQLIKDIYQNNIPCLAVCFGHQIVAHIFGGKTVRDCAGEAGFQDVPTTSKEDPIKLFKGLPSPVKVYQSHNDAVMKAPSGSIHIIYNEKCVQYYQYGSIMSIQSHPEIDIMAAKHLAKRDNNDEMTMLNGVNKQNIKSQMILDNFYAIVEKI